ncbi:hypothetical protein LMG3458_00305 [Achromobacter deleyi]|uniref:Uncharacterized protein n=1 Tax=Achromobacter deleyi TaxID=1353891 RepID=A0A6S6ZNN7_9BURK|nr:hypothetical protein [Achromobacter deleyi]CAB3655671.1 hypothetical protein LMG3458_00305 [Achromobacter deleyi]CAB3828806.1 hypothetical protein LMG3482_00661 [Achromobacter deleyi]CAB3859792.1 hypothetical protein LMG3481_02197 [Achromobacter deleyi]
MPHPTDPGIPTLTQRAEPTLSPSAGAPDAPVLTEVAHGGARAYADDAFPMLTDVAESSGLHDWPADDFPVLTDTAESDDFPLLTEAADLPAAPDAAPVMQAASQPAEASAAASEATVPPQAAVLAARLQAEVEQAMRLALADAIEQIQARMDEELPRIVARVLQDVRPG